MKITEVLSLKDALIFVTDLSISEKNRWQLISILSAYNWLSKHCHLETTYQHIIKEYLYQMEKEEI